MNDKTFPKQQYFSAEDCQTLYPPGTPYGNDHPNGWQDMADRLNALLASRLQASAVVVPELPTWEDGDYKMRRGEKLTALEKFIMDHDWHKTDTRFRDGLEAVFAELRANQGGAAT